MGPRMRQLLATLYVTSSLTLFTWGGGDPNGEFCLRTLICCRPTAILGPILDTVVISHDVEGTSCEELGWHVNSCLLRPFPTSVRAHRFASSVVTPRGYKAGGCPCTNLCPHAQSSIASLAPSLWVIRKRDREADLETGERVVELTGRCFFFPSKPWQSRDGSHQRSCKSTYKTLCLKGS
jgi:hypothetical protein